jgi:DNA-binding GntR family transcriptional regulator
MSFRPKETLTEQVAFHLENMIITGQLHSGERIYENAMSKQLEVSHGCIREALLLLEKRYLVTNISRKGTFVTELNEYFVRSLYETMLVILSNTGRKLTRHWQPQDMERLEGLYQQMKDFYEKGDLLSFLNLGVEYTQASLAYADNYFLTTMINDLWPSAKRCSFLALRQGVAVIKDNLDHMRHSLDAIQARDEVRMLTILEHYAAQQCEQVITCIQQQERVGHG